MTDKSQIFVSISKRQGTITISYNGSNLIKQLNEFNNNITKDEVKEWFINQFN